ncbi:hypothetical protein QFC24_000409 [Naganishia onofrii]|uniref:Uncharacterized protein n=1 Tax=Naganishia onofrii TaxID=1851511 RepID=A0ACC2XY85_9TREE|nr:hypothetical protein QFC24_000409 [Naganishia onofrii]
MPPRPARSTQAASSNIPVRDTPLVTPASRSSSTTPSARSNESLTPVPSTPVHEPLESSTEPEDLLLPQPRLATAAEVERLNDIIAGLQRQVEGMNTIPSERHERHPTFERETPRREMSYAPTSYSSAPHHPKLKASDLPKFSGKDNEDVDQWIEKVSAIFEYSGVHDSDLLQQLPLVLQGNALTWFTQLGKDRLALRTWHDWQLAIRNAFYMPNHRANLRRQCLYRTLRVNESFGDYFADKKRLQSYVFPESTPQHELIEDMIEGIPLTMQPLVKASISRFTTMEEFRRILIDLEPGLRGRKTYPNPRNLSVSNYERTDRKDGSTTVSQTRTIRPTYGNTSDVSSNANPSFPPRTNCFNCGGNHWRRDCPHPSKTRDDSRSSGSSRPYGSHAVSESNRTPMSGNKWKSFSKTSNAITTRARAQHKEPRTPEPSPDPYPVPIPKPVQPKPISPFPDTPGDIPTVSRPPVTSTSKEIPSEYKDEDSWKDKTPAYANCAFERVGGFSFPVCIDSGSSISIIDGNFANEYLPNCRREKCSSFELKGLGNAIVTESLYTTLYFKSLNTATLFRCQ